MWKKEFLDKCKEMNVNVEKYFEIHFTKSENNARYSSRVNGLELVAEYFVLYLKHRDIWLAWRKQTKLKRSVFSVKKESIDNILNIKVNSVKKNVQFSGWGEENVYVFTKDEILNFIEFAVNRVDK